MSALNPRITTVEVGIRTLREVTIYPLSLADQARTAQILSKAFQKIMDQFALLGEEPETSEENTTAAMVAVAKQLSNVNIAETVVDIIQENLKIVLKLVVDEGEEIQMGEIDNDQFYTLVETIYKVNYEKSSKNFVALWKGAKQAVPLEKAPKKKKPRRKMIPHSMKSSLESADGTDIS